MDLASALAPRLAFRLRNGQWCDHRTYRFHSWMDEVEHADMAAGRIVSDVDLDALPEPCPPDVGWGPWELADLGRMKIRFCVRCGHMETTLGHPVRDWLRESWNRWVDAGLVLAFLSGCAGAGVVVIASVLTGWR